MNILVCGLPGTGKTTYCKYHMSEDALCYDLDAIASAFRLRSPHEEKHDSSRMLANQLLPEILFLMTYYTRNAFIIRTAPELAELAYIKPDQIVICEYQYVKRTPHTGTIEELLRRIDAVESWGEQYSIPVVHVGKFTPGGTYV